MSKPIPNLRHLRAFREVAACKSVSEAAERVYMSQPAITQAVAKLEGLLGVHLFDRRSDGMYVTDPGRLFLARVDRALRHIETGAKEAARIGHKRGGKGFANFSQLLTAAQLRALVAVSTAENFSLAARAIGISQPSLHRAARDLERLSGMSLFIKTGHGIQLTRAGEVLAQHAKLAFSELDQGFVEVEEWLGLDSGTIVVGSMPLARTFVLPQAINALTARQPDARVCVVDGPYRDLLHGLRHGEIDLLIGALRDPLPIDDVVQEPLFHDPLAVVARAGHPLVGRPGLSVADLAHYSWVVPRPGTPTRKHFDNLFIRAGVTPPASVIEASSLVLIRGLLLGSDRLTLISEHQVRHEEDEGLLVTLPFDLSGTERPIGLTLRKDWQPTRTQTRFLTYLREAGAQVRSP